MIASNEIDLLQFEEKVFTFIIFFTDRETGDYYQPKFPTARVKRAQWGDNWCLIVNDYKEDLNQELIWELISNKKVERFIMRRD
jgi:uncharacterized protein (DUF2237 family)